MKSIRLLAAVAGTMLVVIAARAAPAARTEVRFDHPENFTDVKDAYSPTDKGRDAILAKIRDRIVATATPLIPAGDTLTITFTDIKLAGDFEPWRGPSWTDVRIVKSVYPPDFKFSYAVTDAAGRVLVQGKEDLLDNAFQFRLVADINDPLRYEKQILDDWVRLTLRDLRRG